MRSINSEIIIAYTHIITYGQAYSIIYLSVLSYHNCNRMSSFVAIVNVMWQQVTYNMEGVFIHEIIHPFSLCDMKNPITFSIRYHKRLLKR